MPQPLFTPATEPTDTNQAIILRRAVQDGHDINVTLWYDAEDTGNP
jgi:hypothetical protein